MKPETEMLLAHANVRLADARSLRKVPRVAAREAYLAALSAARALIFETRDKVSKTHGGTRALLYEVLPEWPTITREAAIVLAKGFERKTVADYGPLDGPDAITAIDAEQTLADAALFIDQVATALTNTAS